MAPRWRGLRWPVDTRWQRIPELIATTNHVPIPTIRSSCMTRWLIVCLGLSVLGTPPARAAEPTPGDSPLNRNAALKYWQGFASLPKLTEEQQKLLEAPIATGPLDDRLKEIVTASTDALREIHHGAKIADCAWGVSFEDGFNARLNHLQAARTTARIACLRARLRIADGNVKGDRKSTRLNSSHLGI